LGVGPGQAKGSDLARFGGWWNRLGTDLEAFPSELAYKGTVERILGAKVGAAC
jgi:hypothetical protein